MTEVELRKLDDEMFDAYMGHNVDVIVGHCSADVVMQDFGGPPIEGKDAVREYLNQQFGAFSDEKGVRTRRIIGDNEVFAQEAATGTKAKDCDRALIISGGVDANSNYGRYKDDVIAKFKKLDREMKWKRGG